jgi:predicted secreted protein
VSWVSGVVLYIVIWWLMLFMVLPWGVKVPDQVEPGMATSAPERPRMWLKLAITSGISAVAWAITYLIITSNLFTLRPPP